MEIALFFTYGRVSGSKFLVRLPPDQVSLPFLRGRRNDAGLFWGGHETLVCPSAGYRSTLC